MDWLRKLFNPMAILKDQLHKEMVKFTWSSAEREILIGNGYSMDDIIRSEQMIRKAGGAWVDRTVK